MTARDIVMGAAGNSGPSDKTYIEDVFSTYLYTGNGSTQTINNGIALGEALTITPGAALGGGYFAGVIKQGGTDYAVIVAPKATGESSSKAWKQTPDAGPAATQTLNNGQAASSSMNSASYPAAQFCEDLSINGYTDWYLPSRDELELCYRNLKPDTIANSTSSRTISAYTYPEGTDVSGDTMGINRNSSPAGGAYIASSPSQTSVTLFQIGNTEAFAASGYWSSSEFSTTNAWFLNFYNGFQNSSWTKNSPFYTRAVRRIALTDPSLDPYRVAGKGGMVWLKSRSGATDHAIYDTARGATYDLTSTSTNPQTTQSTGLTSFGSSGFSIGSLSKLNTSASTYSSWTFRKAPKFFDVVTYTGNGSNNRNIPHSLGITPGMIVVKKTSGTGDWWVWHNGLTNAFGSGVTKDTLFLNGNSVASSANYGFVGNLIDASNFGVGQGSLNQAGWTYVAYLFAHDTTTDGLIQCGSFTTDASGNATVNLGWEPQYILLKSVNAVQNWITHDAMRAMSMSNLAFLYPNTTTTESTINGQYTVPTATGFNITSNPYGSNTTYIYMAIRRGPMKTPTDATKVFKPLARSGTAAIASVTGLGFAPDLYIAQDRSGNPGVFFDKLRGVKRYLKSSAVSAEEAAYTDNLTSFDMNGVTLGADTAQGLINYSWAGTGHPYANWAFKRSPGFFDVVCYTGTGVARTVNHNLGVAPELMIVKQRNTTNDWIVGGYSPLMYMCLVLNSTAAQVNLSTAFNNTTPTSTTISVGAYAKTNDNGVTYVAYLFASCPGVSKVFSFTGNGSSQTINCGFTNGARFVMIKRTDNTGDWYIWDTARGIVAGDDPHLSLNTTAAEVATDDTIDPESTGFIVNQVSATNVNVNGASYIGLAIA